MRLLAVPPARRGNGYVDDVLAEGTRVLAAKGVPRIRASTDLGNTPMANAFRRAGYVNFEREITRPGVDRLGPDRPPAPGTGATAGSDAGCGRR
jgi:RimJ/RimL family protein N-acetyltransferase